MNKSKNGGRSCSRRRETSKPEVKPPEVTLLDTPISSPFDQKKYRAIQLQNGLKVLLVQDVYKANKKVRIGLFLVLSLKFRHCTGHQFVPPSTHLYASVTLNLKYRL